MIFDNYPELQKSGTLQWHNKGYKGKGITVVLLDDGGFPSMDMDYVSMPLFDLRDDKSHECQVARVYHEFAPEAQVVMLNYFGNDDNAIKWIMDNQNHIDIINCSFSSNTRNPVFEQLQSLNIPVICSSGNDHKTNDVGYPANLPWNIATGAWYESNDQVAYYSNGGVELDCVTYANIRVATNNPSNPTMYFDGTSASAPVLSGMLSVWLGWRKERRLPKPTVNEVREFIKANCEDKGNTGKDNMSGYGLFTLPDKFVGREECTYTDVEHGRWSEDYVRIGTEFGLMNGVGHGKFDPTGYVTREQMVKLLVEALGFKYKY